MGSKVSRGEMMKTRIFVMIALLSMSVMSVTACGDQADTSPVETADLALNVDLTGDTDVVGFKFKIKRVKCVGETEAPEPFVDHATESLEEGFLPGENTTFEEDPYDPDSQHHFSDHLFTVEPGCYDVVAKPIQESGEKSEDCAIAKLPAVEALEGKVNEYHLISQCRGEARTMLDIIGSLNHPPEVEVTGQKFTCGAGVRICAEVSDPDGDPVSIKWKGLHGADDPTPEDGSASFDTPTTQCATIDTTAEDFDTEKYKVVVKDLGWGDLGDGLKLHPIEDLLPEQHAGWDDPDKSRASLKFPIHKLEDCTPAAMAFIGTTLGAKLSEVANGPNGPTYETDEDWGMSEDQAKTVAKNAINHVNPNLLGDPDPRILLVRDDANNEDPLEEEYIKQLLESQGFTNVTIEQEADLSGSALSEDETVGYPIVWLVNPGYPIDDIETYETLKEFRENGGGVIISGDDAAQNTDLAAHGGDMANFSFMSVDLDDDEFNGTTACGYNTDNNAGKKYKVKFQSGTPLAIGLMDLTFKYGNDIDRAFRVNQLEEVNAITKGLSKSGEYTCLEEEYDQPVDVMTTVDEGVTYTAP